MSGVSNNSVGLVGDNLLAASAFLAGVAMVTDSKDIAKSPLFSASLGILHGFNMAMFVTNISTFIIPEKLSYCKYLMTMLLLGGAGVDLYRKIKKAEEIRNQKN